mgnify:CR=1 FL=1
MKTLKQLFTAAILSATVLGCNPNPDIPKDECFTRKSTRPAWYNEHPMASTEADFSVKTDAVRLQFYGWGLDEDNCKGHSKKPL